jgi:hypothetical protein
VTAESLIKSRVEDSDSCMLGNNHLNVTNAVPYSIISRRTENMNCNNECELIDKTAKSESFAVQVDESTDHVGHSVLLAFVRYITINRQNKCLHKNICPFVLQEKK